MNAAAGDHRLRTAVLFLLWSVGILISVTAPNYPAYPDRGFWLGFLGFILGAAVVLAVAVASAGRAPDVREEYRD
jgi:hypothetical protein